MRRLWALVDHLPQESATYRDKTFSRLEELVALNAELTDMGLRGMAPKKAIKIPRPGDKRDDGMSDVQKVMAIFKAIEQGR